MSIIEKLIYRLEKLPADFTYSEAKILAVHLGYAEFAKGKTSGSRVMFYRERDGRKILLHKPHPGDVMKRYAVKDFLDALKRNGDI